MILNKDKYCSKFWIEVLLWLCFILLIIGAFAAIAYQVEAIRFRYPLDYGEAPLVNQAMQINAGQSIYYAKINQAPFTIANYPPIYVLLLSIFEKAFGPGFWYGRLISVLSAWGSATLIVLITYSHSKNMLMALITGLLFINLPYVVGWSTLARIDHLALFFALLGLFFIIKRPTSEKILDHTLILGALFLIFAIYTRQSYALAAPLGGFLYLLHKNWKRALALTGLVAGGVLLIFFSINVLTDGGFFFNIVTANVNPFDLARVVHNFRNFFASTPTLFILAALGLILIFNRIDGWPLLTGFALGAFLSAITIGKIGSNINYFLEFSASLCLLVGFGLIVLYQHARKLLPLILLCTSLIFLSWQVIEVIREVQLETKNALRDRIQAQDDLLTMEKLVRNHLDEPILADEFMGMLTINDKSLYLQPFEITQLALAGLFNQKILIEQIEQEEFSLILLQEGSWWVNVVQERWTPEMLEAIHGNYRITAKLENTNVYRPKTRRKIVIPTSCTAGMWPLPTKAYLGYRFNQGTLTFFGAGAEGQVPVIAPADGLAYRPKNFPEGSLLIVHEDPFNAGEQVISLFEDMRSFREQVDLISDQFPVGSKGVEVKRGDFIGYQSTWSGNPHQPAWLHVSYSLAGYSPTYLEDYELITRKLINPGRYFGIKIDLEMESVKPIECLP
jgi:hypothetical protein